MKTKKISELFKQKYPSHRLSKENTLEGIGPWRQVVTEKGTYFNKVAYVLAPSWKLLGYSTPPYKRGELVAVVFEKEGPAVYGGTWWEAQEPGIYWIHASTDFSIVMEV